MSRAKIIDGKAIAGELRAALALQVDDLKKGGLTPALAVILVGDDPASHVYVAGKIRACREIGIESSEYRLSRLCSADEIADTIDRLNRDKAVHGILLQLPLPDHLNPAPLIQMIDPGKDVDGLTYLNQGKLFAGDTSGMVPCTPQGSLLLIQSVTKNLAGMNAVVIGRSLLFGKPMAQLLLAEDCTVTMAHSKTRDLAAICRGADILVAAVGRAGMVRGDWIKPGAIVIDVGINRQPPLSPPLTPPPAGGKRAAQGGSLVGDIMFDEAVQTAGFITPVPGGVGPMTIACLLQNTLKSASVH